MKGPLNFLGGLYYQNTEARMAGILKGLAFGPYEPLFDNYSYIKSYSAYAEGYYEVIPDLRLTVGGRYSKDDKSLRTIDGGDSLPIFGIPPGTTFGESAGFSDFTPRVVLAYDVGNANYYASYNKGFKSGGFNSPAVATVTALRPETIDGYEIGFKGSFLDNRARLNVATFFTKSYDVQVASIDPATDSVVQQNAASVKAYGDEVDFSMAVTTHWKFQLNAGYLHSRFTSFPDAATYSLQGGLIQSTQENLSGFPTTYSPNFTGNANVTYSTELPVGWSGSMTLSDRYTSPYDFNPGAGGTTLGYDQQKAFNIVNLTARLYSPSDKFRLNLYVSNLTNKFYYDSVQTSADFGTYTAPALPRTYGLALRYTFR
jgi:iron complex outermembrane receptor protein